VVSSSVGSEGDAVGIDATGAHQLVDLDRYPVLDPDSAGYRRAVDDGRDQLAALGAAELPGFVTPAALAELVADAESLAPRAHRSGGQGTAYLEIPDFSLPAGHPRLTWSPYSVGAVAYDLIPFSSPLRRLYELAPMTAARSTPTPIRSEPSIWRS
jgi:hypothetical protein